MTEELKFVVLVVLDLILWIYSVRFDAFSKDSWKIKVIFR